MTDIKEERSYDEMSDTLTVKRSWDAADVLDANARERAAQPEIGQFMRNENGLVKIGSITPGDVERLFNMGYDIFSPDPEECRRALLYIQQNEPHWLTVNGKPLAKRRFVWL